jgi:uncharacterized membrane protein
MNKMTTSALVLATASLFSSGLALADEKPATTEGTVKCSGVNACKGHSACATATNACKGQNSCKGKGFMVTTAKECTAQGGKEMKDAK